MLIKLTGMAHPDLNGANAVYVDASRVLLICPGYFEPMRLDEVNRRKQITAQIWAAAESLHEKVHGYIPDMTDPVAIQWMQTARAGCSEVSEAYRAINRLGPESYHPRLECTEVQLACGTALEHGVMLTRVWVKETPEEVSEKVAVAISQAEGRAIRRAV